MKIRRSTRLVDMTYYLLQNPRQLVSLTFLLKGINQLSLPLVKI